MHRVVKGLKWAELSSDPWERQVLRGLPAKGKAYERKVLRALVEKYPLIPNPWFEFQDENGGGMASPDGVIALQDATIVVEVKLSWTFEAHQQLSQLYFPLLEKFTQNPTKGIVICKNLRPQVPKGLLVDSFYSGIFSPFPITIVQWLERGPI